MEGWKGGGGRGYLSEGPGTGVECRKAGESHYSICHLVI